MSNKPDILAETVGYAKCNAEAATHDREAWIAHYRNCEAALAERDRLLEVNAALRGALQFIADHDGKTLLAGSLGDHCDRAHQIGAAKAFHQMADAAGAALKRAEGGPVS